MNAKDWRCVATYATIQEAYIAAGMLRDNGIEAIVPDDVMSSVYPMTLTWASVNLLVPVGQAERAKALLDGDQ